MKEETKGKGKEREKKNQKSVHVTKHIEYEGGKEIQTYSTEHPEQTTQHREINLKPQ